MLPSSLGGLAVATLGERVEDFERFAEGQTETNKAAYGALENVHGVLESIYGHLDAHGQILEEVLSVLKEIRDGIG